MNTYTISADGKSITCRVCNMTSFHPADVKEKFCSNCKVFHEDRQEALRIMFSSRLHAHLTGETLT